MHHWYWGVDGFLPVCRWVFDTHKESSVRNGVHTSQAVLTVLDRIMGKSTMRTPGDPVRFNASPLGVFVRVLLIVFVIEGAIMLVLPYVQPWASGSIGESLSDATLLSVCLAPTLWLLIVRPLRELYRERGALLTRVFRSQDAERARVARELHDELGQHLTASLVGLRSLRNSVSDDATRGRADALLSMAHESLAAVRRLARGIGPGVLEHLGLATAIQRLCEDFRATHGIAITVEVRGIEGARFDPDGELAAFRLVQESLTNIARHAKAASVTVEATHAEGRLHVEVRDDGVGFNAGTSRARSVGEASMGLASMRERAELMGGAFEIESVPGNGTRVAARIPASLRAAVLPGPAAPPSMDQEGTP